MSAARRVFLDACVLYPPQVRRLVLGTAAAGLFCPLWSARVLDEWLRAIARKAPEGLPAAGAARAELGAMFPQALVAADPDTEATIRLPDAGDAHVLAAAAAAEAELLLTFNLRDFPARRLAAFGLTARHPDSFLWELWSDAPAQVDAVLAEVFSDREPEALRRALKRARLPRLGKARASA
ncbi:PIN domain-containing protein [Paralimibaculum aggregatum]|uniref:PIN domain-containing protein n=1 Tax=Paralimibaculum aggregatum TaxID=3036245 RepID=A0ABQ6LLQ0_9RHOB|nr:PIN domain-containing protein [Limibaculum sp. NKW23]GMG83244.1 PIN domain-containing protein [Limibaculum sp. NKW23]